MSTVLPKTGTRSMMPSVERARRSIFWKEIKQITAIFVAFAMLLVGLIALFENAKRFEPGTTEVKGWFVMIWSAFDMFALAVGLTLFAPEKENKTIGLLQMLPVSSHFAVFQKLKIGLLSLVVFAAFGCIVQLVEFLAYDTDIYFKDMTFSTAWSQYGRNVPLVLLPIDCFVFGALASLLLKRTLVAALASLAMVVLAYLIPQQILHWSFEINLDQPNLFIVGFLVLKSILYAAAGLVFFRASSKWLRDELWPSFSIAGSKTSSPAVGSPRRTVRTINEPKLSRAVTARSGAIYRSLAWQTSRQYVPVAICLALAVLFYFLAAFLGSVFSSPHVTFATVLDGMFESGLPTISTIVCMAMGWLSFSADQRNQGYRFFQQHGEYPRKLWLVRLAPGLAVTTVCFLLTCWVLGADMYFDSRYLFLQIAGIVCGAATFTFLSFAICHLNSMLHRSIVFTITSSLIMLGIIASLGMTIFRLGDPSVMWFYPFFIFAPLAISWWWAPRWLAGRSSLKHIAIPKLVLMLIGAMIFAAFMYWRVAQVPPMRLDLNDEIAKFEREINYPGEWPTKSLFEASQAISLYESGILPIDTLIVSESDQDRIEEFVDANKFALEKLEQYDESKAPALLDPTGIDERGDQLSKVSMLVAAQAQLAEKNGDLDLALEYWLKLLKLEEQYPLSNYRHSAVGALIRWGEKEGQNQELLKTAIQKVQFTDLSWEELCIRTVRVHQLELENWLAAINANRPRGSLYEWFDKNQTQPAFGVINGQDVYNISYSWTPWELERARRVAHQLIQGLFQDFLDVKTLAIQNHRSFLGGFFDSKAEFAWWDMSEDKPVYFNIPAAFYLDGYGRPQQTAMLMDAIQERRYLQIRLALAGWKLKHKHYPETLFELAPEYFDRVPVDVVYGEEFAYSPNGQNQRVGWPSPWRSTSQHEQEIGSFNFHLQQTQTIPADAPFILPWSIFDKPESCDVSDRSQYTNVTIVNYSGLRGMWQLGLPNDRFPFDYELPHQD